MRGAADGLSLVVPHADPVYYEARPSINVPTRAAAGQGRHVRAAPGAGAADAVVERPARWRRSTRPDCRWRTGRTSPRWRRSRTPTRARRRGSGGSTGWSVVTAPARRSRRSRWAVGCRTPRWSVRSPSWSPSGVDAVSLAGADASTEASRTAALRPRGERRTTTSATGVHTALDVVDDFAPVRARSTTPANGAVYPNGDLGDALHGCARTIRADVGAEIITVDHGSWDHHTWIGTTGQRQPQEHGRRVRHRGRRLLRRPRPAGRQGDPGDHQRVRAPGGRERQPGPRPRPRQRHVRPGSGRQGRPTTAPGPA